MVPGLDLAWSRSWDGLAREGRLVNGLGRLGGDYAPRCLETGSGARSGGVEWIGLDGVYVWLRERQSGTQIRPDRTTFSLALAVLYLTDWIVRWFMGQVP